MKYRCFTALFLSLLLCMSASCALGERLVCIVKDGQYVNVRNRPSSSASALGMMHAGDEIDVDPSQIQKGFFKTTFKDKEAYVSVRYFEIAQESDYIVTANGRVRMRKSPGGSADGFIKPGTRVHVLAWRYGEDGSRWARCAGGSYISQTCLTPAQ